jgi:hypothetical protein
LNELGASYETVELDKLGKEGYELRAELAEVWGSGGGRDGRWPGRAAAMSGTLTVVLLRCGSRNELALSTPAADDGPHIDAQHLDCR